VSIECVEYSAQTDRAFAQPSFSTRAIAIKLPSVRSKEWMLNKQAQRVTAPVKINHTMWNQAGAAHMRDPSRHGGMLRAWSMLGNIAACHDIIIGHIPHRSVC
jgi:hypothetical protein